MTVPPGVDPNMITAFILAVENVPWLETMKKAIEERINELKFLQPNRPTEVTKPIRRT